MMLSLPTLQTGWFADDYWHRFILLDPPAPEFVKEIMPQHNKLDLFRFFDGNVERNKKVIDIGFAPWWTSTKAKGAFFRPLSSLTHWIDHQLWPRLPWPMHAQSILWYGLLIVAASILYRSIMGFGFAAGVATILYAIDDAHGPPIAFLANRNALLAAVFGTFALIAYVRSVRERSQSFGAFACVLFIASLLSGEAGVATLAYMASHVLFLDQRPWRQRIMGCLPFGVILLAWRAYWSYAGYGVSDISVYIDPLHDPALFLIELAHRIPIFIFGQGSGVPPDLALMLGPRGNFILWLCALAFVFVVVCLLWMLLHRDRHARFWGLGMVLAIVPVSATFPSDRLLLFIGIGAFGLIGCAVSRGIDWLKEPVLAPRWQRRIVYVSLVAIVLVHGVIAPIAYPIRVSKWFGPGAIFAPFQINTKFDQSVTERTVVVLNTPLALLVGGLPLRNAVDGQPVPRRVRLLSPSDADVELFRADERTIVVRPDPPYMTQPFDCLFRSPHSSLRLGDTIELSDMTINVTKVDDDSHPTEVSFRFAVSLDDPSLLWLMWNGKEYIETTPPAIGETRLISMRLFSSS